MTHSTQTAPENRRDIAVVGVSALFPGSLDATGFWRDILQGNDLITDVPPSHWLLEDYYDADPSVPDKTYANRGAFLPDVEFDAMRWGVPPNILPETDTSQVLALIVAQQVLEDAARGRLGEQPRDRMSVILGVTSGQELLGSMVSRLQRPVWSKALRESGVPESEVEQICERIAAHYTDWNESTFPGLLGNVVAGRIANRLDLGGTNCVTDAACASTFSALSMGINELLLGDSDVVIAGGVDTMNDIFMFMCFSKTPALSKTGDCRPFSDQADGTMLAEGLSMVALKRLEDAERDGDRIYAVIHGLASSSDGRSKSVYAPVSSGQAKALRRTYERAGYDPGTVELMEAHGTGTIAGDAAEFAGLRMAFEESERDDAQWCALGSVKSQIGHAKAAAGAAGLFKAVLALNHGVLPPTIKVERPNPGLELETSPFHLSTRSRPWVRDASHPRRASVSSFGFGGSNFHVTLGEYRPSREEGASRAPRLRSTDSELVALHAATGQELARLAREVAERSGAPGSLVWESWRTTQEFDASAPARLIVVATSEDDLVAKLTQSAQTLENDPESGFERPDGVRCGLAPGADGDVAFVFSGQGSQRIDMGAAVVMHFGEALSVWDRAAENEWEPGVRLQHVVYPPTAFDDEARAAQADRLSATEWAQPAIGVTSAAYLAVLRELGLEADGYAGHSFGEISALFAAGALSEQDFFQTARTRGELMRDAASVPGAMIALSQPLEKVEELLGALGPEVVIANHNSPQQVVLSGPTDAIEKAEELLADRGVASKRLQVATAFHSPVVAAASEKLGTALSTLALTEPKRPVFSNTTARRHSHDLDELRLTVAEQLASPVRYVDMIETMYAEGFRTFVEVGPGSIQTGLIGRILGDRDHRAVAVDRKGGADLFGFLDALGALLCEGRALDLSALWQGYGQPENPAERHQPKLTIAINGSNYGKPYPPPGGAADLPAPNPERKPQEAPAARLAEEPTANTMTDSNKPPAAPAVAPAASEPIAQTSAPQAPVPQPAVSQPAAPALSQQLLETQRQTAETHSMYLQMVAQSHTAFLEAMGQGLAALQGQPASATEVAAPALAAPAAIAAPAAPPMAAQPVQPPQQPMAVPPAVEPAPVAQPAAEPVVESVSSAPASTGIDTHALMLEVVSEKTGYPQEMLGLEMELEADLGIDSIKRVEILSEVSAKAPGMPEVDTSVMATLVTVGQVVDYMNGLLGGSSGGAAEPAVAATPASPRIDIHALMLEVVSEKTGYPQEMLGLEMELEADLGIDSIKRVEILSEVSAKAPGMPEVDTSVMATLVTVGQVVDYMDGLLGGSGASGDADAAEPAAAASESAASGPASSDLGSSDLGSSDLGSSGIDIHALMLEVVSEKTGYPQEMLGLEMELEADLGIDSIKRVEILSEVSAKAPGMPEVDTSVMATLVTVGQVVEYMGGLLGGTGATSSASTGAPAEAPAAAPILGRFVLDAVERPPLGMTREGLFGQGLLWVTSDGTDLAECLVERLEAGGIDAAVAPAEPTQAPSDLRGVLDLSGLADVASAEEALAIARAAFRTARTAASRLASAGKNGLYVTVQDTGGRFGLTEHGAHREWLGGLAGLARTAGLEWPGVAAKAIDLERGERASSELADALVAELLSGGPETDVGLSRDGRRFVLIDRQEETPRGDLALHDGQVVVATGGARGVTAATLIELAGAAKLKFALLGRSRLEDEPSCCRGIVGDAALKKALLADAQSRGESLTPADLGRRVAKIVATREIRETLRAIEAAGSEARYLSADVADRAALGAALDGVRKEWGGIHALIHGAGVLADKEIELKTDEQFDRVFDTKVEGLHALLEATSTDSLSAIVLFSSVAARCGNVGQSDYAMANETLGKVAQAESRRRCDCVVKTLGWGPWEGGMVTPSLKAHFETLGVPLIPLDVGARMLVDELRSAPGHEVELVLGGEPVPAALAPQDAPRTARVDVVVGKSSHSFLRDHAIEGTPVVPVALVIEWFARAASAFAPHLSLQALHDVEVVRGISLAAFESDDTRLVVRCEQLSNGQGLVAGLELTDGEGRLHYRAKAELVEDPEAPGATSSDDLVLEDWGSRAVYSTDGVLFHGPGFQMIERVEGISDGGVIADLHGVAKTSWGAQATAPWRTDPVALDGGLQLALLWADRVLGGATLPTSIGRVQFGGVAPTAGSLRASLRGVSAEGSKSVSDVVFVDESGAVVARMEGVVTHRLPSRDSAVAGG